MNTTEITHNNPFKISGIREIIFTYKNEIIYNVLHKTRNNYTEKVISYHDNELIYDHDYELHRASIYNWRETALVLGLYYLLKH